LHAGWQLIHREGPRHKGLSSAQYWRFFPSHAFDLWMPGNIRTCSSNVTQMMLLPLSSEAQAQELRLALESGGGKCRLRLHPDKTTIVYCKDANRKGISRIGRSIFSVTHSGRISDQRRVTLRQLSYRRSARKLPSNRRRVRACDCIGAVIWTWRQSPSGFPCLRGWVNYYGVLSVELRDDYARSTNSSAWLHVKKRFRGHTMKKWNGSDAQAP